MTFPSPYSGQIDQVPSLQCRSKQADCPPVRIGLTTVNNLPKSIDVAEPKHEQLASVDLSQFGYLPNKVGDESLAFGVHELRKDVNRISDLSIHRNGDRVMAGTQIKEEW